MVSRCTLGFFSVVLASATVLTAALAPQAGKDKAPPAAAPQDKAGKDKAPPAMSPDEKAEMEKWIAFGTPGPEHKVLDARVGKWTYKGRFWKDPAAPPEESPGTSESKWIMGGRFLQDTTKGTWMGQPFEGMGVTGYDNLKKKYVWSWIDNVGTGMAVGESTYDAAKKTFNATSEMPDVMTGKYKPTRSVETMTGPDSFTVEFFMHDKDGKEFKNMELAYTRAK